MAKAKKRPSRSTSKKTAGPSIEALEEFVRDNARKFLEDPNITSVGVGFKVSKGTRTKQHCIQFTVHKKVAETAIEDLGSTLIPKTVRIGSTDVPTDVLERNFVPSYMLLKAAPVKDKRKQRLATLAPGISVSNFRGTAGTLGLIVFDAKDGTPYMLSNWHVLHTAVGKPSSGGEREATRQAAATTTALTKTAWGRSCAVTLGSQATAP